MSDQDPLQWLEHLSEGFTAPPATARWRGASGESTGFARTLRPVSFFATLAVLGVAGLVALGLAAHRAHPPAPDASALPIAVSPHGTATSLPPPTPPISTTPAPTVRPTGRPSPIPTPRPTPAPTATPSPSPTPPPRRTLTYADNNTTITVTVGTVITVDLAPVGNDLWLTPSECCNLKVLHQDSASHSPDGSARGQYTVVGPPPYLTSLIDSSTGPGASNCPGGCPRFRVQIHVTA